jgi:hypothetical protein
MPSQPSSAPSCAASQACPRTMARTTHTDHPRPPVSTRSRGHVRRKTWICAS